MELNFDRLRSQLILEEGLRLVAYDDATGKPVSPNDECCGKLTIGVGRNLDANPFSRAELAQIGHNGRTAAITHEQAIMLLNDDITAIMRVLDHYILWWRTLDEIRARVLVDMCFNMGIYTLLAFTHFLNNMKIGQFDRAALDLCGSLWYHQVGIRAYRLLEMVKTGNDWTS